MGYAPELDIRQLPAPLFTSQKAHPWTSLANHPAACLSLTSLPWKRLSAKQVQSASSVESSYCTILTSPQRTVARPHFSAQIMVARLLPGLIQATGESLGLHLVSMNEDPHPWINIEHSSIGSEGASLWLPGDSRNWEVLSSQQGKSKANDFLSALQFLTFHFTSWLLLTLWPEWPLITGTNYILLCHVPSTGAPQTPQLALTGNPVQFCH